MGGVGTSNFTLPPQSEPLKRTPILGLICKDLINSNTNHDEFALINNVLKEDTNIKEEIKNVKT